MAALGDAVVEDLADRGSTPRTSTEGSRQKYRDLPAEIARAPHTRGGALVALVGTGDATTRGVITGQPLVLLAVRASAR